MRPRFDVRQPELFNKGMLSEKNRPCLTCLSKLNLPNAALAPIKILRIYGGSYGAQHDRKCRVVVGGLELGIANLDTALVREYPVKIKVMSASFNGKPHSENIQNDGAQGSIQIDRIPNFGYLTRKSIAAVLATIAKDGIDLVHIHNPGSHFGQMLLKALEAKGIPYVLTHHSSHDEATNKPSRRQRIVNLIQKVRRLLNRIPFTIDSLELIVEAFHRHRYDGISQKYSAFESAIFEGSSLTAVSDHSRQFFKGAKSLVLGSAIDVDFFSQSLVTTEDQQELKQRLGLDGKINLIAYHSRILPEKGQAHLIKVAQMLKVLGQNDFHFVIAGPIQNIKYLRKIEAELNKLGLADKFTIVPALDSKDVRTLLSLSSAFVFPTEHEALGRAAIEAMLMRVPVIAHNVGGIPSYIEHAKTGFLIDKGEYVKMAGLIKTVFNRGSSNLLPNLVDAAERIARERFSAASIARGYMQKVYGPVIFEKRRKGNS